MKELVNISNILDTEFEYQINAIIKKDIASINVMIFLTT